MTPASSRRGRPALLVGAILGFFLLEYVLASNVSLNPYWMSDTLTYGQTYSYLPLPAAARPVARGIAAVLLLPLAPVIRGSYDAPPHHWSKYVYRVVFPISPGAEWADKVNHMLFAGANLLLWIVAAAGAFALTRRSQARVDSVRERS